MNKVLNINLGGYPFTIDEDAYALLDDYLSALRKHFDGSEGGEEIVGDIETRMAELFVSTLGQRPIVSRRDVEAAIGVMGHPEDFGAEPGDMAAGEDGAQGRAKGPFDIKTGKRLFRNEDDKILGGVCSGISAFFGIENPLWARLLFVLFTLTWGFGVTLYIILWIVVPAARSAAERLAMRGEPANVSNIARMVRVEMADLSERLGELGKSFQAQGQKKKAGAVGLGQDIDLAAIAQQAATVLAAIVKPLAIVVSAILLTALVVVFISLATAAWFAAPLLAYITTGTGVSTGLPIALGLVVVALPLVGTGAWLLRLFWGLRMNVWVSVALGICWFSAATFLAVKAGQVARQFSVQSHVEQPLPLGEAAAAEVLRLDALPLGEAGDVSIHLDNLVLRGEDLEGRFVSLHIEPAEGAQFELLQRSDARGATSSSAREHARAVDYAVENSGQALRFPAAYTLREGEAWRGQRLALTLRVPEGKQIQVSGPLADIIGRFPGTEPLWQHPDEAWTMRGGQLHCATCADVATSIDAPAADSLQ